MRLWEIFVSFLVSQSKFNFFNSSWMLVACCPVLHESADAIHNKLWHFTENLSPTIFVWLRWESKPLFISLWIFRLVNAIILASNHIRIIWIKQWVYNVLLFHRQYHVRLLNVCRNHQKVAKRVHPGCWEVKCITRSRVP